MVCWCLGTPPNYNGGVFAQRGHSANHYGVHPGNTPANHPPYRSVHDPFKTASGVQNSGPWGPWLPAVESSRLFAQRTHSAGTARAQRTVRPPHVAWTKVLFTRYTVRGACGKTVTTVGHDRQQKAIMPKSPSFTQNMNITHLKTHVSDRAHTAHSRTNGKMYRQNARRKN